MKRNWVFLTSLSICIMCGGHANAQQDSEKFLLYNCKIINIHDGSLKYESAILIEGRIIKKIGAYKSLRSEVSKKNHVDVKGRYVIPGLWDMHVHLEGTDLIPDNRALLPLFLAHGITTIRDCASDLGEQVLQWRDDINSGALEGPTIFTAGRKLEGKNSIWKDDLEIENEEELEHMLDKLDAYKVDFVKITENTLPGDLFLKSVTAARERGYRVSGHVPIDLTIDELVEAGFTSIEHASYLLRLGSNENDIVKGIRNGSTTKVEASNIYAQDFNQQKAIDKYKVLGDKGLYVCPTLIGGRQLAYLDENNHENDEFLKFLTNRFTSKYAWRIDRMANETDEQTEQRKMRYELLVRQLPLIQKSGIKIIAGSDAAALNTFVYPAASLIEELEIFQTAGLKPIEILQTATINGASYFDKETSMASIDEGKIADIVVLNDNPLENIAAIRSIFAVVAKGKYFNRKSLDEWLEAARQTKIELDREREN